MRTREHELPHGKYLLIDPGYADLAKDVYSQICVGEDEFKLTKLSDDCHILVMSTFCGDGTFTYQFSGAHAGEIGVDSGQIALIPITALGAEADTQLGQTVDVDSTIYSDAKLIRFGPHVVILDEDEDLDEEFEEEDEEFEEDDIDDEEDLDDEDDLDEEEEDDEDEEPDEDEK